jgi:hypothetical protein
VNRANKGVHVRFGHGIRNAPPTMLCRQCYAANVCQLAATARNGMKSGFADQRTGKIKA